MDKGYYQIYFEQERSHWWFKNRANILMDEVQIVADTAGSEIKILNVGAGTFRTSELLGEYGKVTSLEFDEDCCQFVREELGEEIIEGSVLSLPFQDNSFDLVCAFDVIEHVDDDIKAIEEMNRVCKRDGYVIITVPAYQFLWSGHDVINHHKRRYTKNQLISRIETFRGFKKTRVTYFNTFLFPFIATFRLIGRITNKHESGVKSDFENYNKESRSNMLFDFLFSLERPLLKVFNFPFGVSILALYKKI